MDRFNYIIVGGGPAGLSAIQSIREIDPYKSMVWISDEPHVPYSKVLLPYLLSGKTKEARLMLIDKRSLEELRVVLWTRCRAVSLNLPEKTLVLKGGKEVAFNKLLIASGASPVFPKVPGIKTKGVFGLRTLNDVRQITRLIKENDNVVIWGGGLVGTQAASALSQKGIPSSLIVSSPYILSQMLDRDTSRFVQKKIGEQGPTLYFEEDIVEIHSRAGRISSIVLKSDKRLKADLLIIGKGVKPNIDFLTGSRIDRDGGVLVNQRMATNISDIYAAGDVTVDVDLLSGKRSHAAIWPKAIEEGQVAGKNMAGQESTYPGTLNMNITTIFGLTVAAVSARRVKDNQREIRVFRDKNIYRKIFLQNGRVIGMVLVGNYADAGVLAQMIRSRVSLDRILQEYKGEPISFNQIYEEMIEDLSVEG